MKMVLAVAATFFAFTAMAEATSSEQPAWVDSEANALTASCGGLRAELIARMDYAKVIHVNYIGVVTLNPKAGKVVGDAQWHRYWADTYVQVVKMLRQDCYPPK